MRMKAVTERGTLILNRNIAKAIDMLIAWSLAMVIPPVGPVAGLLYILIADGFHGGQSPGKRLVKIKVSHKGDSAPIGFKEAILRNIPFAIIYIFFIIPIIGWFLFFVVGIPILLLESYLVLEADKGIRVGDVLAGTVVTEA